MFDYCVNGDSKVEWTLAFRDYFDSLFTEAGYSDTKPSEKAFEITSFKMEFQDGAYYLKYSSYVDENGEGYVQLNAYNQESRKSVLKTANITGEFLEKLSEQIKTYNLDACNVPFTRGSGKISLQQKQSKIEGRRNVKSRTMESRGSYCFPEEYKNKLAQFSEVFTSYRKDWKPLPRLVTPSFFMDKPYNPNAIPIEDRYVPCEGGVGIFVRDYVKNELFFTIVNNINKDIEYTFSPVIKNTRDNSIVYSSEKQSRTMRGISRSRETVKLDKWLEAGTYELSIGDYSCTFEIE